MMVCVHLEFRNALLRAQLLGGSQHVWWFLLKISIWWLHLKISIPNAEYLPYYISSICYGKLAASKAAS